MTESAYGTVTGVDGVNYRVYVLLEGVATGSGPGIPVDVGTFGPRDGQRVTHGPLPTVGTRGLILFPRGDPRNGVWICSVAGPLNSATTTRAGFTQVDYTAEWSGYWHMRDNGGNEVFTWPDGSSLTLGSAPSPTRTIVGSNQAPSVQPFSQAQRVVAAPGPFPFALQMASGLTISGDTAGNLTVTVPSTSQLVNIGALSETLHKLVTDTFVALFNAHVHPDPQGGTSGPPTTSMTNANLTTVLTAG